ncbi:MAG TPA: hypothetical protein VEU96_19220 [Bryobacteraceae bacterium]|nr:hypothetical protein [Bryobacteraceae bacterium]
MLRCSRCLLGVTLFGVQLLAAPPLTTIQDILYRADGDRFTGVVIISWKTFEASDASNIASEVARVTVTNGNLFVQLVPTTTANPPATYAVSYSSSGRTQFTETWVVPASTVPLRVRDVRLAPGAVATPGPPSTTTVQMTDVVGLQSALSLRPAMGTGFAASRAAVINSIGGLDGAVGNLSDCLHVDGTSGACGSSIAPAGNAGFVDNEVPGGAVNGANTIFTLANTPNPPSSVALYRNGLLLRQSVDYTLSANSVTIQAGTPQSGDMLLASYRVAVALPGVGFVDAEMPSGTPNGVNTVFNLAQAPNPAGSLAVYRNGIHLRSGADYTASGNAITFTAGAVPQTGDVLQCSYRIAQ